MALVNVRELRRRVELEGALATTHRIGQALRDGHLTPDSFSIRDLAEALIVGGDGASVGREWVDKLGPQRSGGLTMLEASEGVDVTAFSNITGQIVYTAIMEKFEQQSLLASLLSRNVPTRLSGEKIPGMTGITDDVDTIHPGMPYPHLGFGEDYIETPATTKRGFIVPVTKEAVFFDRTGLIMERARDVGEVMGVNKEKRALDVILGITNTFKWKGTTYNTYQLATPWINEKALQG